MADKEKVEAKVNPKLDTLSVTVTVDEESVTINRNETKPVDEKFLKEKDPVTGLQYLVKN